MNSVHSWGVRRTVRLGALLALAAGSLLAVAGCLESSSLPAVAAGGRASTLTGNFSLAYVSPALLSLRFAVETYETGAASTSTVPGSLNFNVTTGAAIQFVDLFTSTGAALPVLTSQAHSKLSAKLGSALHWPAAVTMADFQGAWALTSGGLELAWAQGVVAPMASGTPSVVLPWSALSSVIANPGPASPLLA